MTAKNKLRLFQMIAFSELSEYTIPDKKKQHEILLLVDRFTHDKKHLESILMNIFHLC